MTPDPPEGQETPKERKEDPNTCPQGHEVSGGNIKMTVAHGRRYAICRVCYNDRARNRRAKKNAQES